MVVRRSERRDCVGALLLLLACALRLNVDFGGLSDLLLQCRLVREVRPDHVELAFERA